ncbi:MAG: peptide ABC transporter substrate-binding protein [Pyrinomonadaceae bacterium]|nr:peptide ABC transporter substrate-binding protein [Pyrinomonadaceae bacterium]
MARIGFYRFRSILAIFLLSSFLISCASSANNRYFGKTQLPKDNVLRYISGSESESLDPHISSGQPEARIYGALFEGLVEYDPKTLQPIPSLAESWKVSPKVDEFIFNLRKNGKWSDGTPITANDFVYSFRRGFDPETASRTASLGYFIKYAEAFNGGQVFIERNGKFITQDDVAEAPAAPETPTPFGTETDTRRFLQSPDRLTIDGSPLKQAQTVEPDPKLKEFFKFTTADLKNAPSLANKIKSAGDPLTKYLSANIAPDALACATEAACSDAAKQTLADGLNKAADANWFFAQDWFAQVNWSPTAKKLADAVAAENKKRETANQKIDEEIAQMTDEAKIAEKAKTKKKPLGKLFYANRVWLEQSFPDELVPVSLVPVKGEDIGIEAVDDYTVRITLRQPAPFFLGLLTHQFFRLVPRHVIEKWGNDWTRPEHIVTNGSFKVKEHIPYDRLIVERDPNNWDAANVRLDGIEFYPVEEQATQLNLYKAGSVDAFLNHTVPASWVEEVRQYKDEYMNLPENATSYYSFNVTKPPFDNQKVRQAFSLAVNRESLAQFRKTSKPLYYQSPSGIFPDYDKAMAKVGEEIRQEKKISPEDWEKQKKQFNPELARKLLGEAGFPVQQSGNTFSCPAFPTDKVSLTFNTNESNRQIAEFVQAQWKQNIGITVPLQNMEFKTFLPHRNALQYQGMAISLWSGDYMDPYTFLGLQYGAQNDGGSGFQDATYDKMLDDANAELDPQKRYEKMARAEYYVLDKLPSMPLMITATNWMKKPYVKGLYPNPGTLFAWKFVYIERDPNKWDTDVENIMNVTDPQVEAQLKALKATMGE